MADKTGTDESAPYTEYLGQEKNHPEGAQSAGEQKQQKGNEAPVCLRVKTPPQAERPQSNYWNEVKGWIQQRFDIYPLAKPFYTPIPIGPWIGPTVLAPTEAKHLYATTPSVVSGSDASGVLDGTRALYVWGEFTYRDAFDHTWCFRFGMYFTGEAARRGLYSVPENGTTSVCDEKHHQWQ